MGRSPLIGVAPALALVAILYASSAVAQGDDERIRQLSDEVTELKALVRELQGQVAELRAAPAGTARAAPAGTADAAPPATAAAATPPAAPPSSAASADPLHGVTINGTLDGYYEYNANSPVGRVNSLRAYDVSSNSFSLNQADLVIESAPDKAAGRRYGMRVDLQWGQATQTLQGNPANELRPEVWRNLFQAYGTYIFPVGTGLTVDFGKWASALGIEGNYTKDQLNYSRALWFNYLPYYHTGIRASYAATDTLTLNYWLVNGVGQAEDFNASKDQLVGFVLTPVPALSWTFNYYFGREHPDVAYAASGFVPIPNAPDGGLRIADSYLSWQASPDLILSAEADYVEERLYSQSPPAHVTGGALYAGYRLAPEWAIAGRAEYLADRGGLFSGVPQYLKEGTLTLDYRPAEGFLVRTEYRRDQSSVRYFPGHFPGSLEPAQPTLTMGLVWWFGQKHGTW